MAPRRLCTMHYHVGLASAVEDVIPVGDRISKFGKVAFVEEFRDLRVVINPT
jgi:hypothetical protein